MKQIGLLGEAWDQASDAELDSDEWYTPATYIEAARDTMGSIDLDPASNAAANATTVHATLFYDKKTNGLEQPWIGNVWENSPYSRGIIEAFVAKTIEEWRSGRMTQAVVLVNNSTDTRWFHVLMENASAMCLVKGRISFVRPDQSSSKGFFGQVFFYFGPWVDDFRENFEAFGRVLLLG